MKKEELIKLKELFKDIVKFKEQYNPSICYCMGCQLSNQEDRESLTERLMEILI